MVLQSGRNSDERSYPGHGDETAVDSSRRGQGLDELATNLHFAEEVLAAAAVLGVEVDDNVVVLGIGLGEGMGGLAHKARNGLWVQQTNRFLHKGLLEDLALELDVVVRLNQILLLAEGERHPG